MNPKPPPQNTTEENNCPVENSNHHTCVGDLGPDYKSPTKCEYEHVPTESIVS